MVDPLSIASAAVATIQVANVGLRVLRATSDLYTASATQDWIELTGQSLHVLDISFLPNVASRLQRSTQGPNNTTRPVVDVLNILPPQQSHSCRLYIEHGLEGHEPFGAHVERLVSETFARFYTATTTKAAFNHRLHNNQMPWWLSSMYTFSGPSRSEGLFGGLIRTRMRVRCVWHDDNRFISSVSDVPAYRKDSIPDSTKDHVGAQLFELALAIIELDDSYEKNKANIATKAMQQRMLLLRLCHAALFKHIGSLSSIERLHNTFLQHLSDPGHTTITSSFLQVISKDSYFWEHIQHATTIFAGALESLLEACHLTSDLPDVQEFRELLIEIRGICAEVHQRSDSISKRLEGRLKFIEIGRSYHESSGLWLLSLLAVIFLPLSLASSLLGMQTRLVDLHYILYDFFGVIVLLGTITITIVIILKLLSRCSEILNARVTHAKTRSIIRGGITFMIALPWALIFSSFLVGMVKDVGLGLRILGFGVAGLGGSVVILASGAGLLYFLLHSWLGIM